MDIKNILLLVCFLTLSFGLTAHAQTTAFTYQGSLTGNGLPASGSHDFEFRLFDAAVDGSPVGSPFTAEDVEVSGGLFTVTIDFGTVFDGSDRYLELAVRPGNSTDEFTTLSPRQRISATPYALKALEAMTVPLGSITGGMLADGAVTSSKIATGAVNHLGTPDGSDTGVVTVKDNGLVGVGTDDPQAGLEVTSGPNIEVHTAGLVFEVANKTGDFVNFTGNESVAASGNLVAIASRSGSAVTLVDISDPETPIVLSQIRDGINGFDRMSGVRRVALSGDLLVISSRNESTVTLADVSDPANPAKLVELIDNQAGWNNLGGAMGVAVAGNLLAITAEFDDAVTIADISNPASPSKLVEIINGQFGFNNLNGPVSALISGSELYIGAWSNAAVTVVDISEPTNPSLLAALVNNEGGYGGLAGTDGLALSGNLLAILGNVSDMVTLVDVTEPANPIKLAEFQNGESVGGEGAETPVFFQNLLVVTDRSESTLTLYDITDPGLPRIAQRIENGAGGIMQLGGAYGMSLTGTNLVIGGSQSMVIFDIETKQLMTSLVTLGSVGIGTRRPLSQLHVVGDAKFESESFEIVTANIDLETKIFSVGQNTLASGDGSAAMGSRAKAKHNGSFVWGDNSNFDVVSTADNEITFRAAGGVRFFSNSFSTVGTQLKPGANSWETISDRNRKKNILPLDGRIVLDKLAKVPISTWHYDFESEDATPHIGPMAQDFKAAFYPGRDDKGITTHEFDGVVLAAIQGLNQKLEEKNAEIGALNENVANLRALVQQLIAKGN